MNAYLNFEFVDSHTQDKTPVNEPKEVSERAIGPLAFLLLNADGETVFSIQPQLVFTALSPVSFSEDTGRRQVGQETREMESNLKM